MPKKPSDNEQAMFDELQAWMDQGEPLLSPPDMTSTFHLMRQDTQSSPLERDLEGSLGARTAGAVILETAQLSYQASFVQLHGNLPLNLSLRYLSRSPHRGVFGVHWAFEQIESQLHAITVNDQPAYRLSLCDGRRFVFLYDAKTKSYLDQGNLGASLVEHPKHQGQALHYFSGETHYYRNGRYEGEMDANNNRIDLSYDEQQRPKRLSNSSGSHFDFIYQASETTVQQLQDHSGRIWQFEYIQGCLSCITTPSNGQRHYRYQAHQESEIQQSNQLLTEAKNSLGHLFIECRYHDNGTVSVVREQGLGSGLQYQYDGYHNVIVQNDAHNRGQSKIKCVILSSFN